MNEFENSVISLAKSVICGEKANANSNFDSQELVDFCKTNNLFPILCKGIFDFEAYIDDLQVETLESLTLHYFMLDELQLSAVDAILNAFERNCVKHMPLKGIVLKRMYPESYLRPMGDIDILIDVSMEPKCREIMLSLGYKFVQESAHEYIYSNGSVLVELHKCLIPPYNKDYYAYFGNGWQRAKPQGKNTYLYSLSPEDNFIYLFVHFAKHYRDGGIGIIHMVDFYVYTRSNKIDYKYVRAELKKLGLLEFYNNIMATLEAWFFDGKHTGMTEFITHRMFSNGEFGTEETQTLARTIKAVEGDTKKATTLSNTLRMAFPSTEKMQYAYPVLKKCKYLLPIMWCVRGFKVLFLKKDSALKRFEEIKLTTAENISEYQKELEYVGLDFNFKEKR